MRLPTQRGVEAPFRNTSEAVKKLRISEIHFRKSLIPNRACTAFGELFQFFHSFSVMAGALRTCTCAGPNAVRYPSKGGNYQAPFGIKTGALGSKWLRKRRERCCGC